jgi:predicted DsbA family dithiol-disulfide isomerase
VTEIVVFADVSCPFAHVGLTRIEAYRQTLGGEAPRLRVRAWPLEIVNGTALAGPALAPKIDALRRGVAPDLFGGFHVDAFPPTTLPALAAEAAAYRAGPDVGMRFSLAVRELLFEQGRDISDSGVLDALITRTGSPVPTPADHDAVLADHRDGVERGVKGSPHFFTPGGDFFCPTLDIHHDERGYDIAFDQSGFETFIAAAFGH